VRVVALEEPAPLVRWCAEQGVRQAVVGGFFVRPDYAPLGQLRIAGEARPSVAFEAPWGDMRACLHFADGMLRIERRDELDAEPAGDLLQAGPLLVADGRRAIADGEDSDVVTGALFVACAAGFRRVLHPGRGGTWGPRLIRALGAGLIVAGVFVTDAGAGFPAGAPEGTPEMSWYGALHELGYVVVMLSWTAACFVLRSRFAAGGRRGWARACVTVVAAVLVISSWPDPDSFTIRVVIATAVQFGLIAAVAARLTRALRERTITSAA
jgi:Protein of unknown function (DUF998)